MRMENTGSPDEAEIRRLIADLQRAVCTKDIERIMAHYASEVVVSNVKPPFRTVPFDPETSRAVFAIEP